MTEFFDRYYPTLCVRRAEMMGMEKLPDLEKDKMLPTVLLAPWLNSIKFQNTFDRISKSVGDRKIIVDLDRYYQSSSFLESRVYFNSLISAGDRHQKWIDLINDHENYIPCVQIFDQTAENIKIQVDFFKTLGRGFVFRFETQRNYNYSYISEILSENMHEDILVIFDTGWQDFSDLQIMRVSNSIEWLTTTNSGSKFVITGSNFPNSFTDYENVGALNMGTIYLLDPFRVRSLHEISKAV